jgi:hypothetical protein
LCRVGALDEGLRGRDEETGRGGESSEVGVADVVASDPRVVMTALGPIDARESVQGEREGRGDVHRVAKVPRRSTGEDVVRDGASNVTHFRHVERLPREDPNRDTNLDHLWTVQRQFGRSDERREVRTEF